MPPPTLPSATGPLLRRVEGVGHVLRFDVEAIDVVQPAVPGLGHDRQAPPVTGLVRRAVREPPGDDRVARHADAVGVGDDDRPFEKSALLHPGGPGHLAVAVEAESAGVNRIVERIVPARNDRRHPGAHGALADFQFPLAADQSGEADLDARDIRDRI